MAEFNQQIEILRQMDKAREAIKRKYNLIKSNKFETESFVKETFKPMIEPLEKLAENNSKLSQRKKKKYSGLLQPKKEETMDEKDVLVKSMENEDISSKVDSFENLNFANTSDAEKYLPSKVDSFENVNFSNTSDAEKFDENEVFQTPPSDSLNKYLSMLKKQQITTLDTVYGVRKLQNGNLMIGDQQINFEDDKIYIGNDTFDRSNGLVELLFKKKPLTTAVTKDDLTLYGRIIQKTNAHRKYYKAHEEVRNQPSEKFRDIISPLIKTPKKSSTVGDGFALSQPYKIARPRSQIDYIYWDDPNELVERLRLLLAETSAGNQNHVNEIQSIIEELREAEIIY